MNGSATYIALLMLVLLGLSCSRDNLDVPLPSEIKKSDREAIGLFLSQKILLNGSSYQLLVKDSRTTPVYLYLQAIYDQITYSIRADFRSVSNNRWTPDRQWTLRIFENPEQIAFVLPGGDMYVSTALLKSIKSESALYYLLSTEALIMGEGVLFNRLVSEFSTKTLFNIAKTGRSSDPRLENIEDVIPLYNYKTFADKDIPQLTVNHVCRTSRLSPYGAVELVSQLSTNSQWLSTRPIDTDIEVLEVCGEEIASGRYKTFVLDRL